MPDLTPRSSRGREVPNTLDADVDLLRSVSTEYWERTFPQLALQLLDKSATHKNTLYNEAQQKIYRPAVFVRCYVDHSPSVHRLSKYGITGDRVAMFYFHSDLLTRAGIKIEGDNYLVGSLVHFDNDLYDLLSQHRPKESFWVNTNVSLFTVCSANRHVRGK